MEKEDVLHPEDRVGVTRGLHPAGLADCCDDAWPTHSQASVPGQPPPPNPPCGVGWLGMALDLLCWFGIGSSPGIAKRSGPGPVSNVHAYTYIYIYMNVCPTAEMPGDQWEPQNIFSDA